MDEPSLGLSPKLTREIFDIVVRINRERGVTILLVEQNAHMALKIADFGYVLEVGRIVMEDTGARLAEKEDIREFYLGMKAGGVTRDAAMETQETLAMTAPKGGADTIPKMFWRGATEWRGAGQPAAEAFRHLAEHHLGRVRASSRARSAWGWWRSASSRANAPRCSPTPTANGSTPTWAFSAPAGCRTASIRPTRRRRSSISARIRARSTCSSRTTSSSTRRSRCAPGCRSCARSSCSTWTACATSTTRR